MERLPGDKDDTVLKSQDEKRALKILQETRVKVGDKYRVGVLWREGEPNLPNNYFYALHRLYNLEKGPHLRSEEAKKQYFGCLEIG